MPCRIYKLDFQENNQYMANSVTDYVACIISKPCMLKVESVWY